MFDADFWKEVINVVRAQKWRCYLTAFGIFWSMFLLVVLLSCGNGFKNGIFKEMGEIPANCVYFIPQRTTENGPGIEKNSVWSLDESDISDIQQEYGDKIDKTVRTIILTGDRADGFVYASAGGREHISSLLGTTPDLALVSRTRTVAGRDINEFDCREMRKVCVIGERVTEALFTSAKDAVGKTVSINGNVFEVIGVCRQTNPYFTYGNVPESIYIPFQTGSLIFETGSKCDAAFFFFKKGVDFKTVGQEMSKDIVTRHGISPTDKAALLTSTFERSIKQYSSLFQGLNILLWLVGLGTLIAGLTGVCNIMMIMVRERRREIGILRATGASPSYILRQISCESLVLTLAAGLAGIIAGHWAVLAIGRRLGAAAGGIFSNPFISPGQTFAALGILVAGAIAAGLIPARKALKIKVIDTLRQE